MFYRNIFKWEYQFSRPRLLKVGPSFWDYDWSSQKSVSVSVSRPRLRLGNSWWARIRLGYEQFLRPRPLETSPECQTESLADLCCMHMSKYILLLGNKPPKTHVPGMRASHLYSSRALQTIPFTGFLVFYWITSIVFEKNIGEQQFVCLFSWWACIRLMYRQTKPFLCNLQTPAAKFASGLW